MVNQRQSSFNSKQITVVKEWMPRLILTKDDDDLQSRLLQYFTRGRDM
jgi:hypothetical protein